MRFYCTYFDHNYLPRGLALYHSLRRHSGPFQLWVLCLSESCRETLTQLALPGVNLISLAEFEASDATLLQAKANRSLIEYYFTCTPCLPRFILRQHPDVDRITYLDADLYFFDDPELIHAEIGNSSIAITPHRFPPQQQHRAQFGIYNVGWLTFQRDPAGLECLNWWCERCLEWCYDRLEATRFADQKYLNDWPTRFRNVKVLDHPGINLAPWNLANHTLSGKGDRIEVDGQPLIFFHFHGLKQLSPSVFDPRLRDYDIVPRGILRQQVYQPYLHELQKLKASGTDASSINPGIRHSTMSGPPPRSMADRVKLRIKIGRGLASRKYFFVSKKAGT